MMLSMIGWLIGKHSVRDAFAIGQARVVAEEKIPLSERERESEKFLLLTSYDNSSTGGNDSMMALPWTPSPLLVGHCNNGATTGHGLPATPPAHGDASATTPTSESPLPSPHTATSTSTLTGVNLSPSSSTSTAIPNLQSATQLPPPSWEVPFSLPPSLLPHGTAIPSSTSTTISMTSILDSEPLFKNLKNGKWLDVTPKYMFSQLPPRTPHFVGRNIEMYEVITMLTQQRLVTIRGPPGIGKSSLTRRLAHYLLRRGLFRDGVCFVMLRGCTTTASVYAAMHRVIDKHGLMDKDVKDTKAATANNMSNSSNSDAQQQKNEPEHQASVLATLKDKDVLLVWDNAEDPLTANPAAFRALVGQLMDEAAHVTLLLGSRQAIGGGLEVAEKVYTLHALGPIDSARLFSQWSPRPIALAELKMTRADDSHHALMTLSQHPVLKFLGGHPQAISLAAPLLQDRSLAELQQLLSTKSLDALQVAGCRDEEKSAVNTLVASLDASLDHLRKYNMPAVDFFCLMALLPSGVLSSDFDAIWGQGWQDLAVILIRASLIVRNRVVLHQQIHDKYYTFPFVTKYAERLLVRSSGNLLTTLLTRSRLHFARMGENMCSAMGMGTTSSVAAYELLEFHELNFWAGMRKWDRPTTPLPPSSSSSPSLGSLPSSGVTVNPASQHPSPSPSVTPSSSVPLLSSSTSVIPPLSISPPASPGSDRKSLIRSFAAASQSSSSVLDAAYDSECDSELDFPVASQSAAAPSISRISTPLPPTPHGGLSASPVGRLATIFSTMLYLAGRQDVCLRAAERGVAVTHEAGDLLGEANLQKSMLTSFSLPVLFTLL
jgi:hypothetical protein